MLKLANREVFGRSVRTISCSCGALAGFKKQGKVLSKLMYGSDKNKRKWYDVKEAAVVLPSASSLTATKGQGKESTRRLNVLNKLFMEQITDLMATGEYSEELLGYGIQISRVKVATDFHGINVFWFARDSANDMEIGRLLKRVAGGLRHELSQLRVIGQVPKLTFVKDKTYGLTADVDSALRKADFGEDFVPKDSTLIQRSEIQLQTELPASVRKEISQLEDGIEYPRDDLAPLPKMRHDVLGLDHELIMNKIKRSLSKSKQAWTQYKDGSKPSPTARIPTASARDDAPEEDGQFKKYLERRSYTKATANRKRTNHDVVVDLREKVDEPEVLDKDEDFIIEDLEHKAKK